tara:strand:+ start:345 stop:530 length:186 start_codon:yes stop_codon:yes gene_type:complete
LSEPSASGLQLSYSKQMMTFKNIQLHSWLSNIPKGYEVTFSKLQEYHGETQLKLAIIKKEN